MNIGADLANLVGDLHPEVGEGLLVFVIGLLTAGIDPDEWAEVLSAAQAVKALI